MLRNYSTASLCVVTCIHLVTFSIVKQLVLVWKRVLFLMEKITTSKAKQLVLLFKRLVRTKEVLINQ